jgi:uncharacterized protein YjiK
LSCELQKPSPSKIAKQWGFNYNLDKPSEEFELPSDLKEISGLSMNLKTGELWAIQDEQAKVFKLQTTNNKSIGMVIINFGEKGDYEGIANIEEDLFVVKSNGQLQRIKNVGTETQEVFDISTPLNASNDVEGLCYDADNQELWLVCKEDAEIKDFGNLNDLKHKKAIYAYQLNQNRFEPNPKMLLDVSEVNEFVKKHYDIKDISIKPSGIEIHPITKQIFMIASVGNLLLVFHQNGEFHYAVPLSPKEFPQPEGITFDKHGNLYISNEGKKGKGNLLFFKSLKDEDVLE